MVVERYSRSITTNRWMILSGTDSLLAEVSLIPLTVMHFLPCIPIYNLHLSKTYLIKLSSRKSDCDYIIMLHCITNINIFFYLFYFTQISSFPFLIFLVADIFSFRSGFLFCFCLFVCLHLVSCIPYDASFSVLSIIDSSLCFIYRLVSDDGRDKYCNQTCEDMIYAISIFARQFFFQFCQ